MSAIREFLDSGRQYPLGIALGFVVLFVWNGFFITMALSNSPQVDHNYEMDAHR